MPSIFVQLASYHDYELSKTIMNAIEMSSKKHVLNFGVSLCYYTINDVNVPNLPNINVTVSAAPSNIGLGVGRMIAHKHYAGEDYYFQVDSHSRFDLNWDEYLISEIRRFQLTGIKKPLITCYPKGYRVREHGEEIDSIGKPTVICFTENRAQFKETLIPTQLAYTNVGDGIFTKSVSGGSIFTVGEFIKPNMRVAFYGEEIFIAARAFTNGYDLLIPNSTFMSHLYFDHTNKEANRRRLVWNDFPDKFEIMNAVSYKEIQRTFTDRVIDEYHLGSERSLRDFEIYSGLNFSTGDITEC